MKKQKLIINADDYGRSPEINNAIRECFKNGLITDSSVMTTCPDGLNDLLIPGNMDCLQKSAGCHLCLTLGAPLLSEMHRFKFVNALGEYVELEKKLYNFTKEEKHIIYNEFMAQIEKLRQMGINITHIDSHQHIHLRMDLFPIVVKVCKDSHIPYLRIPSRPKDMGLKSRIATWIKTKYIKINGIKTVDFFGAPGQILSTVTERAKTIELMCHPTYNSRGVIVNKVRIHEADECQILVEQLEDFNEYESVSFSEI